MQPLLRRMYAAVMSTPALADGHLPTDPAQAAVLAAVGAALDHVDLRPQLLPRRPQLLPQLMRAVNDPDASGRGIAAIIAQDPALAANLLRIANSALYRPQGGPLESLERAVVHIGTEGVRQIVAAAVMQPVLSLEGGLYARLPAAVWDYALRTAAAAAAYMRERGGDTLSAQLAGLLQGLGAVVILRVLRDAYAERPSLPYSLEVAAALVERHTAAVAKTIATTWDLPAALGTALDEQRPEHDTTLLTSSLGMALRYGAAGRRAGHARPPRRRAGGACAGRAVHAGAGPCGQRRAMATAGRRQRGVRPARLPERTCPDRHMRSAQLLSTRSQSFP